MSTTRVLFVHALSPLHAGTGQSAGAVDLAIARDRATGLPYLPGSSLKGSLRDRSRGDGAPELTQGLFGREPPGGSEEPEVEHRGGALFGDAVLLLLPVRSVAGTFAWATSPYLLHRFIRDLKEVRKVDAPVPVSLGAVEQCCVGPRSALKIGEKVIFEDLDLTPVSSNTAHPWITLLAELIFPGDAVWQQYLAERFCIVHDDLMSFLALHGTAVSARVALDPDSRTVKNLWHEESLPPETILQALIHADPPGKAGVEADDLLAYLGTLTKQALQLGGKATVGRGRCRLVLVGKEGAR
ncbi:MAG: type III-B CRISPR module RAMP protein Cmr4 [Myxococcales bacterium]|nr:type III-B CRISPR module RAMP protein Cmr4 [Myxococcales bacterium]